MSEHLWLPPEPSPPEPAKKAPGSITLDWFLSLPRGQQENIWASIRNAVVSGSVVLGHIQIQNIREAMDAAGGEWEELC